MRFVIGDDNSVARGKLESAVVVHCGFEVVGQATTGAEAIALCRKYKPDVAILDNNMRDAILGEVAAEEILAKGYAKHVILATLNKQLVEKWRAEGKNALSKPFDTHQIAKAIKALPQ